MIPLPLAALPSAALAIWPRCNTFSRSSATTGDNYGIAVAENATVRFEAPGGTYPTTPSDVMKNLFAGQATGGTFTHVWNDDANPLVSYRTFALNPGTLGGPQTNSSNLVTHNIATVTGHPFNNDGTTGSPTNDCESEDGIRDHGIQSRVGKAKSTPLVVLAALVPNPADEQIICGYSLPLNAIGGELLIRESLQGKIMRRLQVLPNTREVLVDVLDLPPGLYLVSLVAGSQSSASRRLQVIR